MKAYDFIGNPCNYRGYVIQWSRGRLLSRFGEHIYSYNADGVRYKKTTASGVVHTYHLEGTRIHKEQRGTTSIYYIYDESGIVGMNYNGSKYYFQKNLQGDVVRIYNASGVLQAQYFYDAWGNHKVCDASGVENTSATFIGNINPFRYRGYYFDAETGLYYLQSRYYDSQYGRFINADDVEYLDKKDLQGLNLYVYCGNNPVNYKQSPVNKTVLYNNVHLKLSLDTSSKMMETKTDNYVLRFKNTNKKKKLNDSVVNPLYDGQLIQFDYSKNPDYNIFTSFYYANKLYEMGLPAGRTYEGIWFELLGHYIIHKLDIFDLTDRDDVADMGSYKYDNNAYIWENIIHGIMKGLENWYYDYW